MMPFGMSLGAGGLWNHHHMTGGAVQRSSSQHQHGKHLRKLTTAAAAATAGVAGMHLYRTGRLPVLPPLPQTRPGKGAAKPLLQIPRELAEVICGAVGEIVQVAVLYPLDTIKASIFINCIYCCQIHRSCHGCLILVLVCCTVA
jgi:hypothetical protein